MNDDSTEQQSNHERTTPSGQVAPSTPDLALLERRVELAERLADTETLADATDVVAAAGGLDGVRALDDRLDRDREELRRLAARVETLQNRAVEVEIPTETLTRLGGEEP